MDVEFSPSDPPEFLRSPSGGSGQAPPQHASLQHQHSSAFTTAPSDFILDSYGAGYDHGAFVGYAPHGVPQGAYPYGATSAAYAHESMFQAAMASQMNPMILLSTAAEHHPGGMPVHASQASQAAAHQHAQLVQMAPPQIAGGPVYQDDTAAAGQFYGWHEGMHRSSSVASSNASSRAESPALDTPETSFGPHSRSHSSGSIPVHALHPRAGAVDRGRRGSASPGLRSPSTKSPLRAGYFTPQAAGSPVPGDTSSEIDLARMRVEDDGGPDSPGASPRRPNCESPSRDKRPKGGGVLRAVSLPVAGRRPSLESPRNSPRITRRAAPRAALGSRSPCESPVSHAHVDSSYAGLAGVLGLEVEPAQFGRFRYEKEGRQNCLEGCEADRGPTVCVNPEWAALVPDGSIVTVSLVRRHDMQLHHHVLACKDGSEPRMPLKDGRAEFNTLVVKRQKSDVRHPPEDQRAVRLLFRVTFLRDGMVTEAYCVSKPIFNSDLKISFMSHRSGPSNAFTDAIILCSKIQKKSIAIRIAETTETDFQPDGDGWQQGPDGAHVCVIRGGFEVHHQYAVVCRFPPFAIPELKVSRDVYIQLVDLEDETSSNFEMFTYISAEYDTNV